jgi:hypothetical protein
LLSGFFLIWTLIKWSKQYILDVRYIFFIFRESFKIIKTATRYCLFQFCICNLSTYFINECTCVPRRNFYKRTISGTCTNNSSKIKLSTHRGRITFAWIWRLTGITFARSITIARKMYLILFFSICADYLLFRIYLIYS